MPILAIRSTTRSLQSTRKRVFRNGTDRQTHTQTTTGHRDLKTELAQRANFVKILFVTCTNQLSCSNHLDRGALQRFVLHTHFNFQIQFIYIVS